jgi:sulfonate transport system permease protein
MTSKSKNLTAHLALPAPSRLGNAWKLRLKGLALPMLIIPMLEYVVRIGRLPS